MNDYSKEGCQADHLRVADGVDLQVLDKNKKRPAFYVPKELDPRELTEEARQPAAYLMNLIHWNWICWKADEAGYVRLRRTYLNRVMTPKLCEAARRQLIELGVIEVHRHYVPGRRSMGYRLAPNYRRTRRILCSDDKLAARIEKVQCPDHSAKIPVHRWLQSSLDRVQVDRERAARLISGMEPREQSTMEVVEYRELLAEQCRRIIRGEMYLACDLYGRVHTPITSLARELRACLLLDGQPLVGFDLANSQPLIAGIVACNFHSHKDVASRLRRRSFKAGDHPYRNRHPKEVTPSAPSDLKKYLELCESGELYESFEGERDRVKRGFLTAMFCKKHWDGGVKEQIKDLYPSVARMLNSLKFQNYKHPAHVLQNAESSIFIGAICHQIMEQHPNVPLLTIHDSLLTTHEHVGKIRRAMEEAFLKLGVDPTLKLESY